MVCRAELTRCSGHSLQWAPGKGTAVFISGVGECFTALTTGSSHPGTWPGTTSNPDFQTLWGPSPLFFMDL